MSATDIRAAGGVLWRTAATGAVEIAVVHRNRYDDWSLPKGKLDGHETPLLAAVREVGEETGRVVAAAHRLHTVRYDVGNRAKAVQYWAMRDVGPLGADGAIIDVEEVDRLEWIALDDVAERLTYPDDREVVGVFARMPPTTSVVVLVRHARAGKRAAWDGDDDLRPLDPRGEVQAAALVELLGCFGPTAVFAADRVRCVDTVAPLAARLDLTVTSMPTVSDESWSADPTAAVHDLEWVVSGSPVSVICSQGTAIPGLLDAWLPPGLRATVRGTVTRKAAYWVVGASDGVPTWIDRYDRPVRAG